jgi:CBS domain-containing protein
MSIGDICNRDVVVIDKDASVQEAVRLMRQFHVGALVVCDEREGRRVPLGLLTDRDIVVEVLGEGVEIGSVMVGDIMGAKLLTARESDELWETLQRMRQAGVRRLPVVDELGSLQGIVTMDDVVELLADELAQLAKLVTREQAVEKTRRSHQ